MFKILMKIEFWWRHNFEILIIHKPSLGSRDVTQKIWTRSVQPFWRLLDTKKQIKKNFNQKYFFPLQSHFSEFRKTTQRKIFFQRKSFQRILRKRAFHNIKSDLKTVLYSSQDLFIPFSDVNIPLKIITWNALFRGPVINNIIICHCENLQWQPENHGKGRRHYSNT